jgi:uncharacterized protein
MDFNMRKILSALFLSSILLGPTVSAEKLPIWELDGTQNKIILLGSIHYLRPSDYPLPIAFDAAYNAADEILMELDMDDMGPFSSMLILESLGKDSYGRSLEEQIGSSRYRQVKNQATALGIDMLLLDDKEAWYAAVLVSQIRLMQMGFDPAWGIETRYTSKAVMDGKTISGLETMKEQLGVLDNMSIDTQAEFLLESLNEQSAAETEMRTIVAAWKTGDIATLEQTMFEGIGELPELYQNLVVLRNKSWAHQLYELDQRNNGMTYLVIVGGMHLVGQDSVQNLLRRKGIGSRQLSN